MGSCALHDRLEPAEPHRDQFPNTGLSIRPFVDHREPLCLVRAQRQNDPSSGFDLIEDRRRQSLGGGGQQGSIVGRVLAPATRPVSDADGDIGAAELAQVCFGLANKTQTGPRQKVTKPFRLSGRAVHGDKSSSHERPRDQWIEIPVPAIVSEDTFALAAERLADNKRFAPRRTIEPSIVQGLVSCRKCGYALSRTAARTSARKIHYYRCLGSDAWRHLGGPVCDSRPIRQDLLDQIVWQQVIHLIEDPT